jgi:hypothetical protein
MGRIRRHLTYANVMASIAVFLVLSGGTAVALSGSNTVFSDDIVDGEVQNGDLGSNAVSGSKVFPSTLTGSDVAPGGLTGSDIASDSLASSDIGASAVASSEVANGSLGTADFAGSIPAARVTRTTNQGVPDVTETSLNFNSERYDTASMHSTSSNLSRLTAPVTGIYLVTAHIYWQGTFSATSSSYMKLRKNGDPFQGLAIQENGADDANSISTVARLVAGDYVEAQVLQASGSTQSIRSSAAQASPEFTMTWLAPGP